MSARTGLGAGLPARPRVGSVHRLSGCMYSRTQTTRRHGPCGSPDNKGGARVPPRSGPVWLGVPESETWAPRGGKRLLRGSFLRVSGRLLLTRVRPVKVSSPWHRHGGGPAGLSLTAGRRWREPPPGCVPAMRNAGSASFQHEGHGPCSVLYTAAATSTAVSAGNLDLGHCFKQNTGL